MAGRARLGREDYHEPVTKASEPGAAWLEVWPLRLAVAIVVVVALALVYLLIFHLHLTGGGNPQG